MHQTVNLAPFGDTEVQILPGPPITKNREALVHTLTESLVERLRKRAQIRRQIPSRKSVQNKEPDRLADLLDEAAQKIEDLEHAVVSLNETNDSLQEIVNDYDREHLR